MVEAGEGPCLVVACLEDRAWAYQEAQAWACPVEASGLGVGSLGLGPSCLEEGPWVGSHGLHNRISFQMLVWLAGCP